jgi:fumarate hydratase subunit beta
MVGDEDRKIMPKKVKFPLTDKIVQDLHAGDSVLLTGILYVARDTAHKRMIEALQSRQPLPFDIRNQTIYYMGPSPAKPGQVIGSAGPTTSGRMDSYTPRLIEMGLKGMIGKGHRSRAVKEAMLKHKAVYFGAIGGAGALMAKSVKESVVIAYAELGAEAIRRIVVEDFPVTVINDIYGDDLYEQGKARYRMDRAEK